PLGGSRGTKWESFRNTMVIFLLGGLWHGANWTFIVWGAYHALLFAPLLLLGKNRKYTGVVAEDRVLPSWWELGQMAGTFALAVIGWIIFRAESIGQAFDYMAHICNRSLFSMPVGGKKALLFAAILTGVEWIGRRNQFALQNMPRQAWIRYTVYYLVAASILFCSGNGATFIYFQF
ncbi:MAG: MBOAT family protein, partial [Rikenella sp.]|nr:MBOAT family protein [Rikenella sp.]